MTDEERRKAMAQIHYIDPKLIAYLWALEREYYRTGSDFVMEQIKWAREQIKPTRPTNPANQE